MPQCGATRPTFRVPSGGCPSRHPRDVVPLTYLPRAIWGLSLRYTRAMWWRLMFPTLCMAR